MVIFPQLLPAASSIHFRPIQRSQASHASEGKVLMCFAGLGEGCFTTGFLRKKGRDDDFLGQWVPSGNLT